MSAGITEAKIGDVAAEVGRSAAPVFAAREWEWRDVGIPDAAQIAVTVSRLMHRAADLPNGYCSTGTGRFNVERREEDGEVILAVTLELGTVTYPAEEARP